MLGFHVGRRENLTCNSGPHRVLQHSPQTTLTGVWGGGQRDCDARAGWGARPRPPPTWPHMPPRTSKSLAASASEEVTTMALSMVRTLGEDPKIENTVFFVKSLKAHPCSSYVKCT